MREIEPEGPRAMLAGLMTQQPCLHEAARSGLVVPRPGPPMAPPRTIEEEEREAGLFLLVAASENGDPKIHETSVNWIRSWQNQRWSNRDYSQFLEAIIETYRANVGGRTRSEIARLLALNRCPRVDRFMRAALQSPITEVRTIARKYLAPEP